MHLSDNRRISNRILLVLALCAMVLVGPAAIWPRTPALAQSDEAPLTLTTVRFVHAVPGAPPMEIRIDGEPVAADLAFGGFSDNITVTPGDRVITADTGGEAPAETSTGIDEGSAYVITILGQIGDVRIKVNEMRLNALDPGKARLRVIHASPDAGEIDLAVTGGDNLFDDVEFEEDTAYKEIDAGRYDLDITTDDGTAATSFALDVQTGRVYDLIALGLVASQTFTILPIITNVSPPCSEILGVGTQADACVRVVHAQPDLGEADAAVAGNVVGLALQYGQATDFVAIPAGDELEITVAPAGQQVAADNTTRTYSLDAGQAYDVIAWTPSDEATVTGGAVAEIDLYPIDLTPLPDGQGRVRFIHVAGDTGELDVVLPSNSDDPVLFGGVGDSNASPYDVLDAGSHDIEVHFAGEEGAVLQTTLDVEPGIVYDVVAIGRVVDGGFTLLVLTVPAQIRSDTATPAALEPGATPISQ